MRYQEIESRHSTLDNIDNDNESGQFFRLKSKKKNTNVLTNVENVI